MRYEKKEGYFLVTKGWIKSTYIWDNYRKLFVTYWGRPMRCVVENPPSDGVITGTLTAYRVEKFLGALNREECVYDNLINEYLCES